MQIGLASDRFPEPFALFSIADEDIKVTQAWFKKKLNVVMFSKLNSSDKVIAAPEGALVL